MYWNSRLEAEHKRVIDMIKPGEILCDAMAGIGPFRYPGGEGGSKVYANDLNPQCARYLRANAMTSKVKNLVKCYNLDARAFMRVRCFDRVLGRTRTQRSPSLSQRWEMMGNLSRDRLSGGQCPRRRMTRANLPRAQYLITSR